MSRVGISMKKSVKIFTFFVIFAFITSGFLGQIQLDGGSPISSPGSHLESTYTPQVQFTIDENSDFAIVASSGDGSAGNPWIIEGWIWNIWSVGYAIYVTGTTDHFIIQNCYIYGFFAGISIGIVLDNVQNGRIENVIFAASSIYLPEPPNPSPPYGYPSLATKLRSPTTGMPALWAACFWRLPLRSLSWWLRWLPSVWGR